MKKLSMIALCLLAAPAMAAERHIEGSLPNGARYMFDVPENWNGTLLLFSHGYARGPDNPAKNTARGEKAMLLAKGYALAGSSYAVTGWAIEEAVPDQLATLDAFTAQVGKPSKTLAWGNSMGGLVTIALVERYPERFAGGLAQCASASGTVGMMNIALDGAFAFKTLAAPASAIPLLWDGAGEQGKREQAAWQQALDQAQASPQGRARIALAATLAQVPPWSVLDSKQPAADDVAGQQFQLYRGFLGATLLPRGDQLKRAGGNFSWNTGIDYAFQLERSGRAPFVRALYREAGADLDADLAKLSGAARIAPQADAVGYMKRHYGPTGKLSKPMLIVQTVADPATLVELSGEYARLARASGAGALVREAYVQRVGHCNFKPGESVAALLTLDQQSAKGAWKTGALDMKALNALAPEGGDFIDYSPAMFLRPCSGDDAQCLGEPKKP
ncbi:MAG: prolyl oligopeptidase family serine peptidase [Pseudomonadota bacterium]